MRIAVVSNIHGNRTAFEAVLADLQQTAPDAVMHAGDLADGGSASIESPAAALLISLSKAKVQPQPNFLSS